MDPSGQAGNEQSYNSVSNIFSKNKSNPIFADSEGHKMYNLCLKTGSGIGSLSSDVFQRRTSTESEPSSLLVSLDAAKFVWLSVFTLIETICPRICSKSQPKSVKTPLPVDVRRSKTSLLKLPNASAVHLNPNFL